MCPELIVGCSQLESRQGMGFRVWGVLYLLYLPDLNLDTHTCK